MAKANVLDNYDQWAMLTVACNAAAVNGSNIASLTTGITNLQKVAWAISRVEFWLPSWFHLATTYGKGFWLTLQNSLTADPDSVAFDPSVIESVSWVNGVTPAARGEVPIVAPLRIAYEVGHERLMLPQNIALGLGWSLSAAPSVGDEAACKIWYKEVELGPEDWYDLLQLRLPLGAA